MSRLLRMALRQMPASTWNASGNGSFSATTTTLFGTLAGCSLIAKCTLSRSQASSFFFKSGKLDSAQSTEAWACCKSSRMAKLDPTKDPENLLVIDGGRGDVVVRNRHLLVFDVENGLVGVR